MDYEDLCIPSVFIRLDAIGQRSRHAVKWIHLRGSGVTADAPTEERGGMQRGNEAIAPEVSVVSARLHDLS